MTYEVKPGAKIGRLTVLSPISTYHRADDAPKWKCRCECGKLQFIYEKLLERGQVLSCGCLKREQEAEPQDPWCPREDCCYFSRSGCVYFLVEGRTRTALHEGENIDINNPCREYAPGEKVLAGRRPFTLGYEYF